jgi:hypothetical protein
MCNVSKRRSSKKVLFSPDRGSTRKRGYGTLLYIVVCFRVMLKMAFCVSIFSNIVAILSSMLDIKARAKKRGGSFASILFT